MTNSPSVQNPDDHFTEFQSHGEFVREFAGGVEFRLERSSAHGGERDQGPNVRPPDGIRRKIGEAQKAAVEGYRQAVLHGEPSLHFVLRIIETEVENVGRIDLRMHAFHLVRAKTMRLLQIDKIVDAFVGRTAAGMTFRCQTNGFYYVLRVTL